MTSRMSLSLAPRMDGSPSEQTHPSSSTSDERLALRFFPCYPLSSNRIKTPGSPPRFTIYLEFASVGEATRAALAMSAGQFRFSPSASLIACWPSLVLTFAFGRLSSDERYIHVALAGPSVDRGTFVTVAAGPHGSLPKEDSRLPYQQRDRAPHL